MQIWIIQCTEEEEEAILTSSILTSSSDGFHSWSAGGASPPCSSLGSRSLIYSQEGVGATIMQIWIIQCTEEEEAILTSSILTSSSDGFHTWSAGGASPPCSSLRSRSLIYSQQEGVGATIMQIWIIKCTEEEEEAILTSSTLTSSSDGFHS